MPSWSKISAGCGLDSTVSDSGHDGDDNDSISCAVMCQDCLSSVRFADQNISLVWCPDRQFYVGAFVTLFQRWVRFGDWDEFHGYWPAGLLRVLGRISGMHKMWTIAVDDPGVCESFYRASLRGFAVQTWLSGSEFSLCWRLSGDWRNILDGSKALISWHIGVVYARKFDKNTRN